MGFQDYINIPSPCYVLEEELLIKNLELLKKVEKEADCKILCALKGYAMWNTFPLLNQYLEGATASSLNEVRLIVENWGKKAHSCSPVYLDNEIDEVLDNSSHITFNSLSQWERFKAKTIEKGVEVALRINPEYSGVVTDLYNPCMPGSRLGITKEMLGNSLPEGISGLHFHALCEQDSTDLRDLLRAVEERFGDLLKQVKWVNFGGGHHITRKGYDVDLLIELIREFKRKYKVEVLLEPGEAIGWQTGFLKASICDIVEANGIKTAMLDVSFSAHMPDCIEMPYKPEIRQAVSDGAGAFKYRMGGLTCLSGDFVGDYSFDNELEVGDTIILEDMIHYTFVKSTMFNGVGHPSIGIIKTNKEFELVKSFNYQDYKNRLS